MRFVCGGVVGVVVSSRLLLAWRQYRLGGNVRDANFLNPQMSCFTVFADDGRNRSLLQIIIGKE